MRFDAFNKKYIKKGVELYFDQINPKDFEQYDIVVAGSDQIWHKWYDLPGELEYFYLNFVPQEKRVAYAPSFGFEKFPEADIELHKKGLGE